MKGGRKGGRKGERKGDRCKYGEERGEKGEELRRGHSTFTLHEMGPSSVLSSEYKLEMESFAIEFGFIHKKDLDRS